MAETLNRKLGVSSRLVEGGWGEFAIVVNGRVVAKKGWFRWPSEKAVVAALQRALETEATGSSGERV